MREQNRERRGWVGRAKGREKHVVLLTSKGSERKVQF